MTRDDLAQVMTAEWIHLLGGYAKREPLPCPQRVRALAGETMDPAIRPGVAPFG